MNQWRRKVLERLWLQILYRVHLEVPWRLQALEVQSDPFHQLLQVQQRHPVVQYYQLTQSIQLDQLLH